jgi:hypothetical protein
VIVKMRQRILLHHNGMFLRNGNGKLYNFHGQLDWLEQMNFQRGRMGLHFNQYYQIIIKYVWYRLISVKY